MTWLDGRIVIDREDLDQRVPAVAALAAEIAATPLPAGHRLSPWRTWVPADVRPPSWGDPGVWHEAIASHRSKEPPSLADGRVVLLHRDLHPLNILWSKTPAVVDWVNACVGHPHAELGHCRWNLAMTVGPEAADRFLDPTQS
ncbi:MAG: aminoglycoside phosphotransferase family protein [Acidimicrobiia bacterium]|nr:aminoglycoside phosphotransferase family protein [Acidimicrobiia bacterium]